MSLEPSSSIHDIRENASFRNSPYIRVEVVKVEIGSLAYVVYRERHQEGLRVVHNSEQPPLVLRDRTTNAEKHLRALRAELRPTVHACHELANDLERRSDLLQHFWRFAAVDADLERSIDKNFADIKGTL